MTSLYKILKSAKLGAGAAQDFHTAIMAQKMPFAKGSGVEHEYTGAVPVTFTTNGQPLLDYLISGNTVQNGTPTPDSPVMPQGTGERTGNLWNPDQTITRGYYNDSGALVDDLLTGHSELMSIGNNTTFTINNLWYNEELKPNFAVYEWDTNKQFLRRTNRQYPTAESITFTTGNDTIYISFQFKLNWDSNGVMLNTGSAAKPYEPYGYKIPISSAGQTAPVYLGEAQTTRKIKKLVFDGTEAWNRASGTFYLQSLEYDYLRMQDGITYICSCYPASTQVNSASQVPEGTLSMAYDPNNQRLYIKDTTFASSTDFKAYLAQQYAAGTPVTVWYVLATEETAVVNEPLMKIGSYADSISMEQANVEIPTARGTNTLDVLTDVKPSEVYIKYKS